MKYQIESNFLDRYSKCLNSKEMKDIPKYSKSDYWKFHASEVNISIKSNSVEADGKSGFYAPSRKTLLAVIKKIIKLIANPSKLLIRVKVMIGLPLNGIKHLDYFKAFDLTMSSSRLTQPQLSPFRINFNTMVNNDYTFASVRDCKNDYKNISGGKKFSDHTLIAYYYLNIINNFTNLKSLNSPMVLEIGGGNGNLSSIIKWHYQNSTIIDVDLPETISHSILYINNLFPEAKILMPNEAGGNKDYTNYDFVFLTPGQISLIPNDYFDVAINTHSFQEMTHSQINDYFELIQRSAKKDSFFFTANRVEKIPSGNESFEVESDVPPNRFSEFPWNKSNEVLIHEICRLFRLVQLDSIYNRLEKIKK